MAGNGGSAGGSEEMIISRQGEGEASKEMKFSAPRPEDTRLALDAFLVLHPFVSTPPGIGREWPMVSACARVCGGVISLYFFHLKIMESASL